MANNPGTQSAAKTAQTTEAAGELNLLDQVIGATRQTDRDQAQMLLKALTEEALKGTVSYSRNMTMTFRKAIELIDKQLSQQVAAIMHHPDFLKLEGSWRGLNYLVMNSETGTSLKIKMLNASKKDLAKDLAKAVEFDQS
jgi:type VI secretion system protein ImpC